MRRRLEAPGTPTLFDLKSAHFALGCLCRLAQYTVYREIPEDKIKKEWTALATPLHQFPASSETIWSVDVVFSYLPSLFRIANTIGENDPLISHIRDLAKKWPLSGVRIHGIEWKEEDFAPVLSHGTLSGLHVDRIFERKDRTIAAFPSIRSLLDQAIGEHQKQLAPWLVDISSSSA